MSGFESMVQASMALSEWFWGSRSKLPEDVRDALEPYMAQGRSPVDAIARTVEVVYAARDRLPKAALELASELALLGSRFGFYQLGEDGRGEKISLTLRKAMGERAKAGQKWPAPPEPRLGLMRPRGRA